MFSPGTHGTTFGGNPVAAAGACYGADVMSGHRLHGLNVVGVGIPEALGEGEEVVVKFVLPGGQADAGRPYTEKQGGISMTFEAIKALDEQLPPSRSRAGTADS